MRTALVAVAGGSAYQAYAEDLMESALEHFRPTEEVEFHVIPGIASWPAGTMMRYHKLLDHLPHAHFVFMIDADMLMVGPVGPEILPPNGYGITATQHPGYVGFPREHLPFERRLDSASYVSPNDGDTYHCGGFVGGERLAVKMLAIHVTHLIDIDIAKDIIPAWHDESALNRVLASDGPDRLLSPSYCYPRADEHYRANVWHEEYEPKIIAIDKPPEHREGR